MSEPELNEPVAPNEPAAPETVEKSVYESVSNDMHKYKRQAQDNSAANEQLRSEIEALKTDKLKETNNYKELYESTQAKLEETTNQNVTFKKEVVHNMKLDALREHAVKKGLRDLSDLDIVDLSSMTVETTNTGKFNVLGADLMVENLQKKKAHWFNDGIDPGVNNSTGSYSNEKKTYSAAELNQLKTKDPAAYLKARQEMLRS